MEPRKYQIDAIDLIHGSFRSGHKHTILCAVTAFGKTILGAEIIRRSIAKNKNVLWLADRKELIWQAKQRFEQFGIGEKVGVIMSGEDSDLYKPIQIASVATYHRRLQLYDLEFNKWFHNADLVFYDECHLSLAPTRKKILDLYQDKYLIGLSATPGRSDKCAMGEIYDDIVYGAGINELTEMGYLVPVRYYGAPEQPDLHGVGTVRGDYDPQEAGKCVNKPHLVGDLIENWLRIAESRQTIVFAQNRSHSKHIRDEFLKHGIKSVHIDAYTKREERLSVLDDLNDGRITVVTNCNCYTEGVDVPAAAVCVIAKPVKFVGRYLQMGGRVLRPFDGKCEAVIMDHANCVGPPFGHGFLSDPIEWKLDGKEIKPKKKPRRKDKTIFTCDMCHTMHAGLRCPTCGHTIKEYTKKIDAIEADLVEIIKKKEKPKNKKYSTEEKRQWYAMFDYERRRLNKSNKWLLAQYRSKFKVWPRNMDNVGPIEPTKEVKNWLTYQRIKWIKSRQKQEQKCV